MSTGTNQNKERLPSSFRDPSGFLYREEGALLRRINSTYIEDYQLLKKSGLLGHLIAERLLLPHEELDHSDIHQIIKPQLIPFISYPYEWCFGQLKDAAFLTLDIQRLALEHGMSLKDATAYNVQFIGSNPIFIDTLSFERYQEGRPWVAYRQFCQHFLAPLLLIAERDLSLAKLSQIFLDGVPLALTRKLLFPRKIFKLGALMHLYLHAFFEEGSKSKASSRKSERRLNKRGLLDLVDSLRDTVASIELPSLKSHWEEYYDNTNYSSAGLQSKESAVLEVLASSKPSTVWDLGSNTGRFSELSASAGAYTLSIDSDFRSVEKNYLASKQQKRKNLLPLVLDITNPSPSLGWNCRERDSFLQRGPADLILALALLHHLAIVNNLPFQMIAQSYAGITKDLVIEFVPKHDTQVQRLLSSRTDVFSEYTKEDFERAFSNYFKIERTFVVADSARTLYWMRALSA